MPPIAEAVEGKGNEHDDGAGEHGQPCNASGVEGTGIDCLRRPQEKREGVEGKEECGLTHVSWCESASAEDQADGGLRQRDHGGGCEQSQGDDAGDGVRDTDLKLIVFALGPELGKEG